MRFDDERRPGSLRISAERERVLADIDHHIVEFDELKTRMAQAVSESDALRQRVQQLTTRIATLTRERDRLAEENETAKEKLKGLRESARYRLGTKLTAPWRFMRRALLAAQGRRLSHDGPLSVTGTPALSTTALTLNSPSPEERLTALNAAFLEVPSKKTLYKLLAHHYFVLGNASYASQLIGHHRELLKSLSPPEQRLVDAIEGLARLLQVKPTLPPIQSTPVYDVERDRWLYCAHSVAPYNSNGYATRTRGLVAGMRSAGMDVVVAARPGYPWDVKTDKPPKMGGSYTEQIEGVEHIFSHGASWTQGSLDHYFQQATDAYVQIARRFRVEGIHAASNHVTALPALMAARRLGLPFTYEVRGLWEVTEASIKPGWGNSERYQFAHYIEAFVASEADNVLAITQQVKAELISRGVNADKIGILSNAVDTNQFSDLPPHLPTQVKLGLDSTVPVIGYAGSLVEYEGLDILLRSLAILDQQHVAWQCVIVGDGPELPRLKELAKSLGLKSVRFAGRVPPSDISNYVSVFDIMPCPRRALAVTEMVPPLKPFEAMAAAKAVVLSDLAPLRALAGPEHDRALLFTPDDAGALARQLGRLIHTPALRRELGRRARLWVVRERTWDAVSEIAVGKDRAAVARKRHDPNSARRLEDVRIGIIADEFTYASLAPECSLVRIFPDTWRAQLTEQRIDALLVESAWEGNVGTWHRKVGYYDAESFSDIAELTDYCRGESIPTIFWNKEDPVHFNRFHRTAQQFEHVFTSDDESIERYQKSPGPYLKTVASLPFYAQPKLHNPLPGAMVYEHAVCYAGSYYGDRYKKRSNELGLLLEAAVRQGLIIYDRQHENPDSPYKFPSALQHYVRGGLTYTEMIEAYKAHPVHINVNSVDDSGTMLSRRVFEIAASGGTVVSGPGRGVSSMFGETIPIIEDKAVARDVLKFWMEHEPERNRDAWLGLRTVLRAHTSGQRLAYMLRTAGLAVEAPRLAPYALVMKELTNHTILQATAQSHLPSLIVVTGQSTNSNPDSVSAKTDIPVLFAQNWKEQIEAHGIALAARLPQEGVDRAFFEDLVASKRYAQWRSASIDRAVPKQAQTLASLVHEDASECWDILDLTDTSNTNEALVLRREVGWIGSTSPLEALTDQGSRDILVAGHDLKFAGGLIDHLQDLGHNVKIDQWQGHSLHDEEKSGQLLAGAEIIFCEWTLGNAVWYSKRKSPGQRLVCRIHLQELETPYLRRINMDAVDLFVFVGSQIRDRAVRDFGIPAERSVVIPNYVDTAGLNRSKPDEARWRVGYVGMVPQRKRLDLALDLLHILREQDKRYTLAIKGRRPESYPWMASRAEEMEFYKRQYGRLLDDPLLQGAVIFDGHGDDMPTWYQKVGTVISVSDFESFHLTIADGAASGAIPQSLAWAGADRIYPTSWIHPSVEGMAADILEKTATGDSWHGQREQARMYAQAHFDKLTVLRRLEHAIITQ